jgi:general stress protein 26
MKMSEAVTREEKLRKLRQIVKAVDICMLTTVDERGGMHSRPMSNNREVEFDGDLWFFTYGSSHKVDEVGRMPKVNASFADIDGQQYASLTGRAEIVRDRAKIEELWQPHLRAWFPEGVETPDIALLKVTAERAEYWDSSQSIVAHAVGLITSLVKGEPAQVGENEKIELK